ncbi:MAG: MoaD/ThiS family protein [Rhodospirillales bacterium]|nr:MoaD/ThiS family protein [Rhodospirillales bacterium]MBO6785739.1 MoaD/ThiS family protein [Rhodospirillales bacterium]
MIQIGFQLVSIDATEFKGLGRDGIGEIPLQDDGSLADAMRMIGMDPGLGFMTLVNGDPVAPENRSEKQLNDGDQVVVFPPIEGG